MASNNVFVLPLLPWSSTAGRLRREVGRYCTSSIGRLQKETLDSKHACRSNNEKLHSLRQSQGMGYRRRKLLKT
eukprot:scaffold2062_cov115-Skeletonema_marinoi.AAC.2